MNHWKPLPYYPVDFKWLKSAVQTNITALYFPSAGDRVNLQYFLLLMPVKMPRQLWRCAYEHPSSVAGALRAQTFPFGLTQHNFNFEKIFLRSVPFQCLVRSRTHSVKQTKNKMRASARFKDSAHLTKSASSLVSSRCIYIL